METRGKTVVAPHHFLIACHFEELYRITLGVIAGDNRVAVGQALHTAGVVEEFLANILIGDAPHNLPLRVYLDDAISIRAANERVAIRQPNGRERPVSLGASTVVSRETAKHFARGWFVFLHCKIQ